MFERGGDRDDKGPSINPHQLESGDYEPVTVRVEKLVRDTDGGKPKRKLVREARCYRRIVDAKLWDSWCDRQQQAAERINAAFVAMQRGLGMRISTPAPRTTEEPIDPPGESSPVAAAERQERLIADYFSWGRACTEQGIDHSAVMDVLGFGHSCRETDARRRRRNGYTSAQLHEGIALYCELKGWDSRKRG